MVDLILTGRQGREILQIHDSLNRILSSLLKRLWPVPELIVTCIYRTPSEDSALKASGIHSAAPPYRAIDIRIRNLDWDLKKAQEKADEIAAAINAEWVYDSSRSHLKVAVSKMHGTGPHLHLQCFPGRTIRMP